VLVAIVERDVLPVVCNADVDAPVGKLIVPDMLLMFQVPLCVTGRELFWMLTFRALDVEDITFPLPSTIWVFCDPFVWFEAVETPVTVIVPLTGWVTPEPSTRSKPPVVSDRGLVCAVV